MSQSFKELPVIPAPKVQCLIEKDPIIGIDLGTTNSLVALVEKGIPKIIPSCEGKNLLPSTVHFLENGKMEVGFKAKKQKLLNSKQTVFSVKRLMGKGYLDIQNLVSFFPFFIENTLDSDVKIQIQERSYTPIEISSFILKELKKAAQNYLKCEVKNAVITVPAYFNDSQRQATRAAGRLAGLQVLRILNEPTAAALAYGLVKKKNGLIAVYDFGGGTFDISILKLKDGIFEVLSTNGDTLLGGDDMDHAIAGWLKTVVSNSEDCVGSASQLVTCTSRASSDKSSGPAWLLETAENLKIKGSVVVEGKTLTLSQEKLKELCLPILQKTSAPVEQALKDAEITKTDLTDVVLVGGPTRLPFLREFVKELFLREPNCSLNPDEVVALGAAIQADIIAGNNKDFLLLDVVPLSLGIETMGGVMSKLIPRNTRIPAISKDQFTTYVDGQTKVAINVYQGERELVKENRKLAEFILHGVPPMPAGLARVEVTFLVDADGILNILAKEIHSGVEQSVEVKPAYGLTDAEVEKLLEQGLLHKEKDLYTKQVIEAKNEARLVLASTEKALVQVSLDFKENEKIKTLLIAMKQALDSEDLVRIKKAHKALNDETIVLASLLMEKTLEQNVKNKTVEHFQK